MRCRHKCCMMSSAWQSGQRSSLWLEKSGMNEHERASCFLGCCMNQCMMTYPDDRNSNTILAVSVFA